MLKYCILLIFAIIGITEPQHIFMEDNQSTSCKINSVHIPNDVRHGDTVTLVCDYEIIGNSSLYNVRWFKGNIEFYRYVGDDIPHKKAFAIKGVTVDINNSSVSTVVLKNVGNKTSGNYSCEVSMGAPYFDMCSAHKNLYVKDDRITDCRINNIDIPSDVNVGDNLTLVCEYDIGDNSLFAVKWYKDMYEFYRYVPMDNPQKMMFPKFGVTIDVNKSSDSKVVLTNVQQIASGNYSCEVTTDAPSFYTCSKSRSMHVNISGIVENKENKTAYIHAIVPHYAQAGGNAVLSCNYAIDNSTLYSVKWYKDNKEFFRFIPWHRPQISVFPVPGVNVNVNSISFSRVILKNVGLNTTGTYKCEVTSDAEVFIQISDSGFLSRLIPNGGPRILVDNDVVDIGQKVQAVCIVPGSSPPTQINWLLNGNEVKDFSIAKQLNRTDLSTPSASFVNLKISEDFFKNNMANLTCKASIDKIYQADTTVIIRKLESQT